MPDEQKNAPDLPSSDQEFVFKDLDSAPGWVDRNWAGYDRGPALQLPNDLSGRPPYTTTVARVGDKVVFTAASGASPAKFTVIPADHSTEDGVGTVRPAQASNASLEDQLLTGTLTVADLGSDAKAQIAGRSPHLAPAMEREGNGKKSKGIATKKADPMVKAQTA